MVLIDFGLSRHDHLPDLLAEEFTIPMGTFPYIAPEQYLRAARRPAVSDLFALGAMIYELATGRHAVWRARNAARGAQAAVARSGAAARAAARAAGMVAGDHPARAGGGSDATLSVRGADGCLIWRIRRR